MRPTDEGYSSGLAAGNGEDDGAGFGCGFAAPGFGGLECENTVDGWGCGFGSLAYGQADGMGSASLRETTGGTGGSGQTVGLDSNLDCTGAAAGWAMGVGRAGDGNHASGFANEDSCGDGSGWANGPIEGRCPGTASLMPDDNDLAGYCVRFGFVRFVLEERSPEWTTTILRG